MEWMIAYWVSVAWAMDCTKFYYVKRPVAAVNHEYVVGQNARELRVFGSTKPGGDAGYFASLSPGSPRARYLGQACGAGSREVMGKAEAISAEWEHRYRRWIPYLFRMGVTPILGKPCRAAARQVARAIQPRLSP